MENEEIEYNWFKFNKPKLGINWSKEEGDINDENLDDHKNRWWGFHIAEIPRVLGPEDHIAIRTR